MKIILLKEVPKLGRGGDVKEVSVGYARNYLIPRGYADILTKSRLKEIEELKKRGLPLTKKKKAGRGAKDKAGEAARLNNKIFSLKAKTDEGGSLYAKVDAKSLSAELFKQGYKVEPKEIKLESAIKKIGEYKIKLDLGGQQAEITLKLVN